MDPLTSSFLYLSDVEKLADIETGVNLAAVERIVIKRELKEEMRLIQKRIEGPDFIEDIWCHGCGDKVQAQDLVVIDSIFYLWHKQCYQETDAPVKETGTYNEASYRYGVFKRNHEVNRVITHCTIPILETT